ncbi:MAG: hypothetical protein QOC93_3424 [Actinomycetota bacterium]|nr:hypothetical protein [Cryptosporangiaceae bacterium]MDQ1678280.1 hypothetical protein [Actinomycetota bacterium]
MSGHGTLSRPDTEVRLGGRGRAVRLGVTAVCALLVVAGTLVGQDDDFPFGPFRMYSTTDDISAPVASTRLEAIDTTGRRFRLSDGMTGMRRAEIEGQMSRFRADPALLGGLAEAYDDRNADRPPLARIEIIIRHFDLDAGRPTGRYTDTLDTGWDAS